MQVATRRNAISNAEDVHTLRDEHQNLESRLHQLEKHRSLSPEEQYEAQVIKKRKLALKDRISTLETS